MLQFFTEAAGKESGIVNTQINPNNVIRDLNGDIWWCSETCLMKYNAELDKPDTLSPQLYFSNLTIDFDAIDYSNPETDSRSDSADVLAAGLNRLLVLEPFGFSTFGLPLATSAPLAL